MSDLQDYCAARGEYDAAIAGDSDDAEKDARANLVAESAAFFFPGGSLSDQSVNMANADSGYPVSASIDAVTLIIDSGNIAVYANGAFDKA